ncbi:TraR/DksA C4-type zinc finger protein [Ruegeria arenilitoris]|uniref:TraR/DksA C4-type zinc finger protein n=1 Tax=Ruegeria arenilitoris TaxID=1173585 RepID=UPI003464B3AC
MKCKERGGEQIWNDTDRLLYDPERTRNCVSCGELIPYPRIASLPNTNICTSCATEGQVPSSAPPHPQPPVELRSCPRCGAPTAMYQNTKFKNWFVGCSTFPKCRWSKWR